MKKMYCLFIILFFSIKCQQMNSDSSEINHSDSKESQFYTVKIHQENANFKVVFINPGEHSVDATTGDFWSTVGNFMGAAANDFNIDLDIIYAERQYVNAEIILDEVLSHSQHPDYVIVVNEKLIAPVLLKKADEAGVKIFLILNDLTKEQKKIHLIPRERYKNWIGTLVPDNIEAGKLIAENTINAARHKFKKISISAINGNMATPASSEREIGLINYIDKMKSYVRLNQITYAEWDSELAFESAEGLLKRYPDTNVIWTANDPMALGALRACKNAGKIPGRDIFIGGLNWSITALEKVKSGELACSVGGHFMVGGWAIVILHDYHHEIDFMKNEGTELKVDVFHAITADNVIKYLDVFGNQDWEKINFRLFSKQSSNKKKQYNFGIEKVLNQF